MSARCRIDSDFFRENPVLSAVSRQEAVKAVSDTIHVVFYNIIEAVGPEQISHEPRAEIIAGVRAALKAHPIAEISLILPRHLRKVAGKRAQNKLRVFVAPPLPAVLIGAPDDLLLEDHRDALGKQLAEELIRRAIRGGG